MLFEAFGDFVEFKNTKEGKKVGVNDKDIELRFIKIVDPKTKKEYVRIVLSSSLVESLKQNKIFSFKFLYNERSHDVLLRYDNSSNAFTFVNKKIRPNGEHEFINKYISATMLNFMKEKNSKRLVYKGRYLKDKLAYIFSLSKTK